MTSFPLAFQLLTSLRFPEKPVARIDKAVPQEIRFSSRELLQEILQEILQKIVPLRQDARRQDREAFSVACV